jgi:hypothetical protein
MSHPTTRLCHPSPFLLLPGCPREAVGYSPRGETSVPSKVAILMGAAAGAAMMAIGGMTHVAAGAGSSAPSVTSSRAVQTGSVSGGARSPISGGVTSGGGAAPLETLVRGLGGGGASAP